MHDAVIAIISGVVSITLIIIKAINDKNRAKENKKNEKDKRIDAALDADDIMRES